MALVSGRPISFQMDLYQPLYVPRPIIEPELFASLRPPTYSGAMDDRAAAARGAAGVGGFGGGALPSRSAGANAQRGLRRAEDQREALGRMYEQRSDALAR